MLLTYKVNRVRASSNSSAATNAPNKAWRLRTRRLGIRPYMRASPAQVLANGISLITLRPNTPPWLAPWRNGWANTHELAATASTINNGPRVSAAQYIRKREPPLRGTGTRQIRFSRSSMLAIISNALTKSTRMPTTVSLLALSANFRRYPCTVSPAPGTKLRKMKFDKVSRRAANAGNSDSIASTADSSGTIANKVVYDSAPAVSKQLSSRNRRQRKCANARRRSRRSRQRLVDRRATLRD